MNINTFVDGYYLENWAGVAVVAGGGGAIACDSAQPSGRPAASTRGSRLRIPDSGREQQQLGVVKAQQQQHSWIGVCAVRMRSHCLLLRRFSRFEQTGHRRQCAKDRRPAVCCENFESTFWKC